MDGRQCASLIGLPLRVYYPAQIFFFWVELTQVWANRHGRQVAAVHADPVDDGLGNQNAAPVAK